MVWSLPKLLLQIQNRSDIGSYIGINGVQLPGRLLSAYNILILKAVSAVTILARLYQRLLKAMVYCNLISIYEYSSP